MLLPSHSKTIVARNLTALNDDTGSICFTEPSDKCLETRRLGENND